MNLSNLNDTIADLKSLRTAIDPAIEHLERAYAALKSLGINSPEIVSQITQQAPPRQSNGHRTGSHLDNVIKLLENTGRAMHIVDITREIARATGKQISRASVDGAVSRHIREHPDNPTVVRVDAGVFGLRSQNEVRSKSDQLTLHNRDTARTRKDQVTDYLKQHGPTFRRDLIANTGIPVGTIAHALNDKARFRQLQDERWDLTPRPDHL